ncbi:MAG: superoxide dismutase [Clostridium sp.]|uniref:superoxide dismutase n=1 Tax=Clostridium sp. TaxID=1506 RepID=UPI002906CE53|nr:superoxide dismutase [Clostridium sp.]MDU7336579.1 superoxide dismutase [Clostridium sp.]
MSENCYEFELKPLPYGYDALEPYINAQTMQVHHDRLVKAYVEKLNAVLKDCPKLQGLTLDCMLRNKSALPPSVRTKIIDFGGGVSNHNFFFASLRPGRKGNAPIGELEKAINKQFGSFDAFQQKFKEKAMAVFGSGWLWLVKDCNGNLSLYETANQDSPLSAGYCPLIVIDVWEHAYFLQYINLRNEYIDNWFHVINWDRAECLYTGS